MLKYIDGKKMGRSNLSWLHSHFHFSFAEYYNIDNINFGALRVINDDLINPHTGFDTHPHENMEIITYVIDGKLTHADSMGNQRTLTRGQVQYMSAGTGITHSEHNRGEEMLRLLQIWIFPDKRGYTPNYGDYEFTLEERENRWMPIASSFQDENSVAPVRIHADINMSAAIIAKGERLDFAVAKNRQAYMVLIEGEAMVNGIAMSERDAMEITEETVIVNATQVAHILIIEMKK